MVLINKQPKLSCHMASMPINDRRPFLDLNLSITNGIVSSKIYNKRDAFNFEIVNFAFLDRDVPRSPSYGVYISHLFVLQECALMLMTSTIETYF